ncbi:MAG: SDR family oxidoreductase, partial [Leptolyngbya sp. SIO4C1]|nr:SDR family oxidoreductase [Leptolyngbya sp. SIO4C1]
MTQGTTQAGKRVLVAGATGGVGQLTVAQLLNQAYTVRAMTRSLDKARQLFGRQVEVAIADIRDPETLPAAVQAVDAIICCTGTTAFPSERWQFDIAAADPIESALSWTRVYFDADYRQQRSQNNPAAVDAVGVANLVKAAPSTLQRFVFVSSCGVERRQQFPFSLLNAFGVLDAKAEGEAAIRQSGLPYTIVRPARLTDGPYTSYDLNTLIQATTDRKRGITLSTGDRLNGQSDWFDHLG